MPGRTRKVAMTAPSTEIQPTEPTGATPSAPTAPPVPTPEAKPEDALNDPGKKALAEERAARKAAEKERAELLARLKEFEDRDKTEAQKLADRTAAAEKAAADKDAELLRLRTALKHGISDEDAAIFLTGADEETLAKQAERLVALRVPSGPRSPAPDLSQGARSPAGPTQLTREHLKRMSPEEIEEARVKGQLNDLLGVKSSH